MFIALLLTLLCGPVRPRDERDECGQATAEYALVLLGVAAIALAVVSWASRTHAIGHLLDGVFGHLAAKSK